MSRQTENVSPIVLSPRSNQEFERYFFFRWQNLRQPLAAPIGTERDTLEDQAHHIMVLIDDVITAVGRIHQSTSESGQIRYMAVDPHWHRQGFGRLVLTQLLNYARQNQMKYCWCNARDEAVIFYRRCGFIKRGRVETDLALPHTRMEYYFD